MQRQAFNSKKNLFSLCLASFTVVTGFGVIMPFFPLYASEILSEMKIGPITFGLALQIGIMTSAFMFTRFLLAPAYGDLSDSVGRKPLILMGMTIYAVLMFGFGLAFDFISLFVLRAIQGIASAAVWPVGEALIVDTSHKDKVGKNLGYYMLSVQAGMASGPFIGFGIFWVYNELLNQSIILSYKLTFSTVGIFGFLATIIVALMVSDPKTETKNQTMKSLYITSSIAMISKTRESPKFLVKTLTPNGDNAYRSSSVYVLYLVAIINGFSLAMIFPITTLFLNDYYGLKVGEIALLIGLVGLPSLMGGPMGGHLSDRIGRKITVWSSGLIVGIAFFFIGFNMWLPLLVIIFIINRFLFGVMQPSFRALQSDLVPEKVRGKEFGVLQAFSNFGSVLGPIIGGLLYDLFFMKNFELGNGITYFGAGVTFAFAGLLTLLGSILLLLFVNYNKDKLPTFSENFEINPLIPLDSHEVPIIHENS